MPKFDGFMKCRSRPVTGACSTHLPPTATKTPNIMTQEPVVGVEQHVHREGGDVRPGSRNSSTPRGPLPRKRGVRRCGPGADDLEDDLGGVAGRPGR